MHPQVAMPLVVPQPLWLRALELFNKGQAKLQKASSLLGNIRHETKQLFQQ